MRRFLIAIAAVACLSALGWGRVRQSGWCEQGAQSVVTNAQTATGVFQRSYPSATVSVYATGTTNLATIYSDNLGTAKANPFTADATGAWFFYADNARYDVQCVSGATTLAYGDFSLLDPVTFLSGNQTVSGTWTFSGATNLNGGGALAGTFTGNPTLSGNLTLSGTNTHSGVDNFKNLGGVLYADQFSGVDIGAKINAAYATLGSTGGTIDVPCSSYSFSTPIVFATVGKHASIRGQGKDCTILNFTGTTGSAVTFNAGMSGLPVGEGLYDLTLKGPGSGTSVGITAGGTNGYAGLIVERSYVGGFNYGIDFVSNGLLFVSDKSYWVDPVTSAVHFGSSATNDGEAITFTNSIIGATVAAWVPKVIDIENGGAGVNISNSSIDCGQVYISGGFLSMTNDHFETACGTPTTAFITNAGATVYSAGSRFYSTKASPYAYMVESTGGYTSVVGGTYVNSGGGSMTAPVRFSGASQGYVAGTLYVAGTFTANTTVSNASSVPGVVITDTFSGNAATGNTLGPKLWFGTVDNSHPMLKQNGTGLEMRVGDDSADSAITASQFASSIPTGTAPFSAISTTPVANLTAVPATYGATGTQLTNAHLVQTSVTLSSGTPSTAVVTLSGSAVFTGSTTYKCALTNESAQADPVRVTYTDGSHFTVTGPNTVTDNVSVVCIGN